MAEETALLTFEVDQTAAQASLIQTEKNIISLKKQQAELNKEYKAGKVAEDDYVESNLKLQQNIKKEGDQKRSLVKLIEAESNSRNALRNRISTLTKEYNNINTATETGARRSDELQKELAQLSDQLNKGSKAAGNFKDNIGNYPEAIQGATNSINIFQNTNNQFNQNLQSLTENINIAGTSVGGMGSRLLAFASPVTAAAGVISLLGSAFLSTRDGAELLEAAQFKLQASFQILGRETASVVDQLGKLGADESGKGGALSILKTLLIDANPLVLAFTASLKLLDVATGGYVTKLTKESEALAKVKGTYDDLLRLRIIESEIIAKLDRDIEKAKTEREEENTTLEKRLELDDQILANEKTRFDLLTASAEARNAALKQEADLLGGVTKLTDDQLQLLIDSRNEIKNLAAENATRTRKILSDRDNVNKAIKAEIELEKELARATERQSTGPGVFEVGTTPSQVSTETSQEVKVAAETQRTITELTINEGNARTRLIEGQLKLQAEIRTKQSKDEIAEEEALAKAKKRIKEAEFAATASILGAASSLFDQQSEEYRIFATAQTLISTYTAATRAYEAAFFPIATLASPAIGVAYAAAAIAQGLANVAAINGVEFQQGGFTPGGPPDRAVGIVHAGEYVAPQHIVRSPAAQPHISALENMRVRGYADGGFVTNQNTASTQSALITANALKNQPPVYVSWVEGQKIGRRVEYKEKISKI